MTPFPAAIRAVSYEDLETLVAFYESRKEWYKNNTRRSMPRVSHENLNKLYDELDRRNGLLDDNYQLIIPQEA
jgi:hypothetical protein